MQGQDWIEALIVRRAFRGESRHKVDTKGRVSIPAGFRRVLEAGDPGWPESDAPEFVIVYGGKSRDYLEAFTIEGIEALDTKIKKLPRGSKKRQSLETLYSTQVVDAWVDNTGRIVLPAKCRTKLGIEGEAVFLGRGDTFEIWHPETYAAGQDALLEADDDFDPDLDPSIYLDGDEE